MSRVYADTTADPAPVPPSDASAASTSATTVSATLDSPPSATERGLVAATSGLQITTQCSAAALGGDEWLGGDVPIGPSAPLSNLHW